MSKELLKKGGRADAHITVGPGEARRARSRLIVGDFGKVAGFTLMEVLVAIAIFVIVGALAMGGYNELVKQSDIVSVSAARTRAVQSTSRKNRAILLVLITSITAGAGD